MNILCDNEGVPLLIQRLEYQYSDMTFKVTFFNGEILYFPAEDIPNVYVGLLQASLSRMQELNTENEITILAHEQWKTWFPQTNHESEALH